VKKITIPLMGGLGNQLFQVSAGLYIEKYLQRNVAFSKSILENSRVGTKRFLEVDELIRSYDHSKNLSRQLLFGRFGGLVKSSYCVTERGPGDDSFGRIDNGTRYLVGYFQRLEIVDGVASEFETLFRESQRFNVMYETPLVERIAVHIRLGDYKSQEAAKSFHGLTDIEYYVQAIDHLNKETGIDEIILVSDEPANAKEMLYSRLSNTKYDIRMTNTHSSLNDLASISSSACVVGSNSTFSWWGAWFATRNFNSRVVMPTPWFSNPSINVDDLMDPNWTLIGRTFSG